MRLESGLIQLFDLSIQPVIFKYTIVAVGQVFDVQMHELGLKAHHLVDPLNKVIGHFVAEAQTLTHVLIEGDGALTAPAALVFLELYFVVFLSILTGGLTTYLNGGVWGQGIISKLSHDWAVLITDLKQSGDLIAWHPHGLIIVDRIMVDLCPAVVCIFAVVAPAHGQVHRHHAAVVIDRIKLRIIPQVDTVDILQRSLFHLVRCFLPRRRL